MPLLFVWDHEIRGFIEATHQSFSKVLLIMTLDGIKVWSHFLAMGPSNNPITKNKLECWISQWQLVTWIILFDALETTWEPMKTWGKKWEHQKTSRNLVRTNWGHKNIFGRTQWNYIEHKFLNTKSRKGSLHPCCS